VTNKLQDIACYIPAILSILSRETLLLATLTEGQAVVILAYFAYDQRNEELQQRNEERGTRS